MHVPDEANCGPGEAVAIIGAALRFPGASDPSAFHELAVAGRRMFRELARRPGAGGASGRRVQGKPQAGRPSRLAALLDDAAQRLGRDEALASRITGRHVLAAQTATAALADVPPVGRAVAPDRIGVFIADTPEAGTADVRDWVNWHLGRPAGASLHDLLVGTMGAVSPAQGPAGANAAAGASQAAPGGLHCSLRAVTAACEALNSGEYDLVLAGGVAQGVGGWTPGHTAAPADDHVRVYDASPTGSLPGEGCGIVVLTRARDARAAEVPAYAEIAGWQYAGTATPHGAVLPEAYERAGVDPADIQFVEGHGAATATDDLAELSALLKVLGPHDAGHRCALGSVSANIGDTRAAAGVAALLKTAFAMTEDVIPPSTGCVRPNPLLRGDATPFRLPSAPEQWPQTPVQLAAVNTLGTAARPDEPRSGLVHVVLRRERDLTRRPGRRRKPSLLAGALDGGLPVGAQGHAR
jgi:enediyne polyketide synthase